MRPGHAMLLNWPPVDHRVQFTCQQNNNFGRNWRRYNTKCVAYLTHSSAAARGNSSGERDSYATISPCVNATLNRNFSGPEPDHLTNSITHIFDM
jgi:hypothetical protein